MTWFIRSEIFELNLKLIKKGAKEIISLAQFSVIPGKQIKEQSRENY